MIPNKFDRILWWFTIAKLRYNRGNSWMNQIKDVMQTIISLYAAKTLIAVYYPDLLNFLTGKVILIIGVGEIFGGYLIGWLDEKKLLLWQRENAYGSRNVNPVFQKMEAEHSEIKESIAELHEKIDGLKKR